ncbi:hypothetical protein [Bacillus gaemokensis]|nr:hypothetical protein [Bacillus gaemokensis]
MKTEFTREELTSMFNALIKQSASNMAVDKNLESATKKVMNLITIMDSTK